MNRGLTGSSPMASRISPIRLARFFSTTNVSGQSRSSRSLLESAFGRWATRMLSRSNALGDRVHDRRHAATHGSRVEHVRAETHAHRWHSTLPTSPERRVTKSCRTPATWESAGAYLVRCLRNAKEDRHVSLIFTRRRRRHNDHRDDGLTAVLPDRRSGARQRQTHGQEGPGWQLAGNGHVPARVWPSAAQVSRQLSRRRNHGLRAIRAASPWNRQRCSALAMASGRT